MQPHQHGAHDAPEATPRLLVDDPAGAHAHHDMPAHGGPTPASAEGRAHDRHEGHSLSMFRRRFWGSLALTIPVLAYAEMLWHWLGLEAPQLPAPRVIPFLLGTAIYVYGGSIFLRSAANEIRDRLPGMMTLVAVGISTAYAYSAATTFWLDGDAFYWELATLVDIMLLGHWIEMRAIGRARRALDELANLIPDTAERVQGDALETVAVADLRPGDQVLVRPGGRIPADGTIDDGRTHVDESMLTGESRPVSKEPGSAVVAGSVNAEGALRITVTNVGDDTALAGIARLVAQAQASQSRAQALADRAARALTYVALASGALTAIVWTLVSDRSAAFIIERTVTVIVIACPHALGLAVPLVTAISTSIAARNGLLVRDRLALERGRSLDVMVFDKTGTLTEGAFGVVALEVADGWTEERAFEIAAGLEHDSEHVIGRAIVSAAARRGLAPAAVESFEAVAGHGVRGNVEGMPVAIGGPRMLAAMNARVDPTLERLARERASEGTTVVSLVADGRVVAIIGLADEIRAGAADAVAALHAAGTRVAMITGDAHEVAASVARRLGIDEVLSQVLPQDKAQRIRDLQAGGARVGMVGDGVNDAPALAQADVGIAIGAGTDVAIEAADVIVMRDDPRDAVRIIALSRASYRRMLQNLTWATGYNVVAIPLAAGVLSFAGIQLAPAVGALLMSASTVVVALNAQLLRRTKAMR